MAGDNVIVSVSRRYRLPAEQVFDAWVIPERAQRFLFLADSGKIVKCEIDARVGGGFTVTDRRAEGDVAHVGKFLEVDRPVRMVFVFGIPATFADEDIVTIELTPLSSGCELTLTAEMAPAFAAYAEQARDSWKQMLDKLAATLGS